MKVSFATIEQREHYVESNAAADLTPSWYRLWRVGWWLYRTRHYRLMVAYCRLLVAFRRVV